jgi:hypothetical protein
MKLKWRKCILHKIINLTVECSCFVESRTSSETIKIGAFLKLTCLTKEFKWPKSSLINRLLDSIFDFLNMFLPHFKLVFNLFNKIKILISEIDYCNKKN